MTQTSDPIPSVEPYPIDEQKKPIWHLLLLGILIAGGSIFIILISMRAELAGGSLANLPGPLFPSTPISTALSVQKLDTAVPVTQAPTLVINSGSQNPPPHVFSLAEIEAYTQPLTALDVQNFINPPQALEWSYGWCAATQAILDSNLQMMKWKFTINDSDIPIENFKNQTYKSGDWFCAGYYTILDNWQPGAYHLKSGFVINTTMNDGQDNYPSGTYQIDKYVYVVDAQAAGDPSSWPAVIQDRFDDNSLGWSVGNLDDTYMKSSLAIGQGKITVTLNQAKQQLIHWETPQLVALSDFKVSVDARPVSSTSAASDCYGLAFRVDPHGASLYEFVICNENQVYLGYLKSNQWTTLIGATTTSAIHPGQSNNLSVTLQGNSIECAINGTSVGSVTDSTLQDGLVGFTYTAAKGETATYEFDNFVVSVPMPPGVQMIPTATK